MEIFLTKIELSREENLFAPHEPSYSPLNGKAWDILAFAKEIEEGKEMAIVPTS
jgi:hypothetical protein